MFSPLHLSPELEFDESLLTIHQTLSQKEEPLSPHPGSSGGSIWWLVGSDGLLLGVRGWKWTIISE